MLHFIRVFLFNIFLQKLNFQVPLMGQEQIKFAQAHLKQMLGWDQWFSLLSLPQQLLGPVPEKLQKPSSVLWKGLEFSVYPKSWWGVTFWLGFWRKEKCEKKEWLADESWRAMPKSKTQIRLYIIRNSYIVAAALYSSSYEVLICLVYAPSY